MKFKKTDSNLTVGYARVSSHDQKKDLQTQAALLTSYCAAKGIDTMTRSHKIRLDPTFKQMSYFRKACGIARFAWNWGLAQWEEKYKAKVKTSAFDLKKEFNI